MARPGPARIDRVTPVTRPVVIEADAQTQIVVTRFGIVLANREERWTWYRWTMAGKFWSVWRDEPRSPSQATREAARLLHACRERHRIR